MREAIRKAIDRHFIRQANAESRAWEDGCYGVLSVAKREKLLEEFILDYEKIKAGKIVEPLKRQPYITGRYVNR